MFPCVTDDFLEGSGRWCVVLSERFCQRRMRKSQPPPVGKKKKKRKINFCVIVSFLFDPFFLLLNDSPHWAWDGVVHHAQLECHPPSLPIHTQTLSTHFPVQILDGGREKRDIKGSHNVYSDYYLYGLGSWLGLTITTKSDIYSPHPTPSAHALHVSSFISLLYCAQKTNWSSMCT